MAEASFTRNRPGEADEAVAEVVDGRAGLVCASSERDIVLRLLAGVPAAAELDDADAAFEGDSGASSDGDGCVELVAPERFLALRAGVAADMVDSMSVWSPPTAPASYLARAPVS